jgi:hypothetical protein
MRGLVLALLLAAPPALADCRQALVLALDVSASVDAQEYQLQTGGLAAALRDAEVRQAFLGRPGSPVALAVFEWSGAAYQRLVLDWTPVEDAAALDAAAAAIERNPVPPDQSTTGIGAAMLYAGELFARGPACAERTLDISGDGQNNDWPRPEEARLDESLKRITINGLVIGADFPLDHELNPNRMGALTNYYANRVIKGLGSFVETATNFEDFGNAMRRKLIRELSTMMLGAVLNGPPEPGPSARN